MQSPAGFRKLEFDARFLKLFIRVRFIPVIFAATNDVKKVD